MQKYQNNVQSLDGRAIIGAQVTVTTYPDGAPATVYSSNGSGVITQPILTNGDGEFAFYAANGRYQLNVTGAGISTAQSIQDIILFDPADGGSSVIYTPSGAGSVSRTVQAKLREFVSIDDYGADPTGIADSSAAILAAFNAAKASSVLKRGIYGDGKYKISSSVLLDAGENIGTNSDAGTNFSIRIGTITPDPGIGVAITLANIRRPNVELSFSNGGNGSATDVAFQWYNVEAMKFDIRGSNYAGVLCKFDGTLGLWNEMGEGRIWSRKCYKAFDFKGPGGHSSGIGRISTVWDILPTVGSTVENIDDLTIDHYENAIFTPTFTDQNSLTFTNCSSIHLGKVALGQNVSSGGALMVINGCTSVDIDFLYVFGGNASGAGVSNGLQVYDSALVSVSQMSALGCNIGMYACGGSNVQIGKFKAINNTRDVRMDKGPSASLSVFLSIEDYFGQACYAESIDCTANVTGGLTLKSGRIRVGNVGGAAVAAINTVSSSSGLITHCNNMDIGAEYGLSVQTFNRAAFLGNDNNFRGANAFLDSFGTRGSTDGRSYLVTVPALSFATNFQNANPFPIRIWIPFRFETTGVAGDFATLKLIDLAGNTHDLVDTAYLGNTITSPQFFTLSATVPAGWSYRIDKSGTTNVTFQGTPRSVRI